MTDINELALLVNKAKASVFTLEYIAQFEPADIDSDDVDLRFEVDGRDTGTNVSIVDECGQAAKVICELVEALEKAQRYIDELREWNVGLAQESCEQQQRIAELESIASDYGAKFQKAQDALKYQSLMTRTVTVKLPELCVGVVQGGHAVMVPYAAGHWFNKTAILEMLTAAGIKWETE